MTIELLAHQKDVLPKMKTGSILKGGVGSGKTIAGLSFYYTFCGGQISPELTPLKTPRDLYVITTARKRDLLDWNKEAAFFCISRDRKSSVNGVQLTVDSWQNIKNYEKIKDAFFIFDEQHLVGSGAWVKSFLKIAKNNPWILLTATPGDKWINYAPVFIANGFYKNRTDFIEQHVVYNTYTNYPKIDRYVNEGKLIKLRNKILVVMPYKKKTIDNIVQIIVPYDDKKFEKVYEDRWNPFKNRPIKNASEYYYTMRRVVNSDSSRFEAIKQLLEKHKKLIVFYNFDYELDILRRLEDTLNIPVSEYNGHFHEEVPKGESWIYLAHYISAGEAWNCIETNAVILYSRNYSYSITKQAMGRIDRQNTPFVNLYYYFLTSNSWIDNSILKSYQEKKNFNEKKNLRKDIKWPDKMEA